MAVGAAMVAVLAGWWLWPPAVQSPVPGTRPEYTLPAQARPRMPVTPSNTLWVLTIGVNEYGNRNLNLEFADHDAQQIGVMLHRQQRRLFDRVEVTCLVNQRADRESILIAADNIARRTHTRDVVFIFVAGHGILDEIQREYYFLPYGADPENFLTRGLRWSEFSGIIRILSARVRKLILAVDTCHAGATARADLASELRLDSGYILSASMASEMSVEDQSFRLPNETRGHGAFTYALLRGLSGEADLDGDSLIKVEELFEYMARTIPEITNGRQHPYRIVSGTETITIAMKEEHLR